MVLALECNEPRARNPRGHPWPTSTGEMRSPRTCMTRVGTDTLASRSLTSISTEFDTLRPLYQVPLSETHVEDSQGEGNMIHRGKRVGFAMAAAIGVRGDYDTGRL